MLHLDASERIKRVCLLGAVIPSKVKTRHYNTSKQDIHL